MIMRRPWLRYDTQRRSGHAGEHPLRHYETRKTRSMTWNSGSQKRTISLRYLYCDTAREGRHNQSERTAWGTATAGSGRTDGRTGGRIWGGENRDIGGLISMAVAVATTWVCGCRCVVGVGRGRAKKGRILGGGGWGWGRRGWRCCIYVRYECECECECDRGCECGCEVRGTCAGAMREYLMVIICLCCTGRPLRRRRRGGHHRREGGAQTAPCEPAS